MSKLDQIKIPIDIPISQWRLTRVDDNLIKESSKIGWIEFTETGVVKEVFSDIQIGRSLLMSPFSAFFTWQTTTVTEIIKQEENYIEFKTQNSHYILEKIKTK